MAESHHGSYKNSQIALLRLSLSVSTQTYFKLGTNAPKLSVSDRPWDMDIEKKCKRKCLRSSRNGPQNQLTARQRSRTFLFILL